MANISQLDYIIIGLYFVFVIGLGFYFKGKNKSNEDYFLAGRSLIWYVIGFSLFASNMSSISLIGLAESGYKTGFAVFSYEWMASIVLIIFAVFFLPFYLKNQIFTVPEFLEKRYGSFARTYFSIVTICLNVFIDIASSLFAGSLIVQMIFPSLDIVTIIWIISIVAAFYTLLGGLASVVYSDVVQALLLILGSIFITVIALDQVGGWSSLTSQIDESMFKIIRPADDPDLPWTGLFSGVFLLGFYFWITNQFIAQRALASKSIQQGQWGAVFAGFLKLLTLFIMVLPGVIAIILYPELDDPKQAYPTLVFDILPKGLLGLVLAGFIAALMSSVDSGLNAASTLFTMDFYKNFSKTHGAKSEMKVAKISTLAFMIIAALWAPHINSFPSFWDYLQMILCFICPPVVALFIWGLFVKRINTIAANVAIVLGIIMSVLTIAYKIYTINSGIEDTILPHYLHLAGYIFIICSLVLFVVSYSTRPDVKDLSTLIWTKETFTQETKALSLLPFYKNYRYQSILLILCILILLIIF